MNVVYTPDEITQILTPIFDTVSVYKAVLFGSYAKGSATINSDVDIVIDSKGEMLNIYFYELLEDIVEKLDKKVDLIEISEIEKNSPIYNEIERDGVVLYEKQR